MYRLSVPMINRTFARQDREYVAAELKKMGVVRVVLAIGTHLLDEKVREEELAILKDNTRFLHEHGFEVSSWMWTFDVKASVTKFTRVRLLSGKDSTESVCCADELFCDYAADYIRQVASCGVDMVLYDDDYRLGYLDNRGVGCLCEHHLAYMSEMLGEKVTFEQVVPYLMTGGENRYRSAWQASKKHYLLAFARRMRKAVNEVAPNVRIGLCACFTVWDLDGVSPMEISRALAGDAKPFLRLIGAPYWAVRRSMGGNRLQDIIELSRMERSFFAPCDDAEIVAEGDGYPRPRWVCPAAYLEALDPAMRADGRLDGILKYAVDYTGSFDYEKGYVQRHLKNMPLYDRIEDMFASKTAVGVRVWESMSKYERTVIPEAAKGEAELCYLCFSYASRMLAAASIPTTYDDESCVGIAFGENARELPLSALKNGMILDARAAEILTERGVDVGLERLGGFRTVSAEHRVGEKQGFDLQSARVREVYPKSGAQIRSEFVRSREDLSNANAERIPAAYTYENENGERFLVLCFEGQLASEHLLRQYGSGRVIKDTLAWLGREEFSVRIDDNPDLYVMAKREGSTMSVGLWNFSADAVDEPVLTVDGAYEIVDTIGCEAHVDGRSVCLSRIEPYGFAAVELKK